MMKWMLRRRKMMMWRRKTDPKTGKHTLCEPAQSKCTWTCHEGHFVWKFIAKMPDPNPRDIVLCEPAQSKRTWTFQKSHFILCGNLQEKWLGTPSGTAFCASLRGRNAHGHFRKAIL